MKLIQLNNTNRVKKSPSPQYKNKLIINKNRNQFIGNNIIYKNNMHSYNYSNDIHSYNLTNRNIKLENPLQINNNQKINFPFNGINNNQKILLPFNGKIKKRNYSPLNIRNNNKFGNIFGNKKNDMDNIIKNRSNSNLTKKKCINYNFDFVNDQGNLYHMAKNSNQLNEIQNNYIDSKYYNTKM